MGVTAGADPQFWEQVVEALPRLRILELTMSLETIGGSAETLRALQRWSVSLFLGFYLNAGCRLVHHYYRTHSLHSRTSKRYMCSSALTV